VLSLRDTFYFQQLSVFYPQLPAIPLGQVMAAAMVLLAISVCAAGLLRYRPAVGRPVVMGGLWFLIAMGPVLNVVQAGGQSRADRFSYISCIGLFIALVWMWPRGWLSSAVGTRVRIALAVAVVVALTIFMSLRLDLWRNPLALYCDGIAHTEGNWYLESWASAACREDGSQARTLAARQEAYRAALAHAQRAWEVNPDAYQYNNLGIALALNGRLPEALEHFGRAHELMPKDRSIKANYDNTRAELQRRGAPGAFPGPG
jgi:tetratricopeptide (TPR) repeat protein